MALILVLISAKRGKFFGVYDFRTSGLLSSTLKLYVYICPLSDTTRFVYSSHGLRTTDSKRLMQQLQQTGALLFNERTAINAYSAVDRTPNKKRKSRVTSISL